MFDYLKNWKSRLDLTSKYIRVCQTILKSEIIFSKFKTIKSYYDVVGVSIEDLAHEYFRFIKNNYPHLFKHFDKFLLNDSIGKPFLYQCDEYLVGGDTLMYIKILGDLEKYFGNLNELKIVEIGGGYGGQCKIIKDLYDKSSYVLVDLPDIIELQKKYLDCFNIGNVEFIGGTELSDTIECDLVISNYAYSEFDDEVQNNYYNNIVKNARMGYMICNDQKVNIENNLVVPILKKDDMENEYENNYVLIWGFKNEQ